MISHLKKCLWVYKQALLDVWNQFQTSILANINFTTFVPRKNVPIHGFWIIASSILIVFAILLEYDVFKLSIYLDLYFSYCVGILLTRRVDASLLRTLKDSCANKTSSYFNPICPPSCRFFDRCILTGRALKLIFMWLFL